MHNNLLNYRFNTLKRGLFGEGVNDIAIIEKGSFSLNYTNFTMNIWLKSNAVSSQHIITNMNVPNTNIDQVMLLRRNTNELLIIQRSTGTGENRFVVSGIDFTVLNMITWVKRGNLASQNDIYVNGVLFSKTVITNTLSNANFTFQDTKIPENSGAQLPNRQTTFDYKFFSTDLSSSEVFNMFKGILSSNALINMVVHVPFEKLYKVGLSVFTYELRNNFSVKLTGYPTASKAIVDINDNDIQLTP
jgi:hypothetical protein